MEGAIEAIDLLLKDCSIFVFTARDVQDVATWLNHQGYDVIPTIPGMEPKFWNTMGTILVTNKKIPAIAYIDDRAIRFENWYQALNDLERYANLGSRSR